MLIGPPGTGESHIAIALTVAAIHAGHTALYRSAFDLTQHMAEADATGTRKEVIANLCKVDLLVPGDTAAAGAILDRFLHHAEVIRLQGRSYRMHHRKELPSKQTSEALTEQTE